MPVSTLLPLLMSQGGGGSSQGQGLSNIAGGAISAITGLFQKKKANQLLSQNQRPIYTIPNEVLQNQKQAQLNAETGLPSEQYNQAMRNIQRQQSTSLQNANDRRGGLLAVSAAGRNATDAQLGLDVSNAKQRLQNQNTLYGVNNQVAAYRDKAFDWNQKQKYLQNYNYAMSLLGAGNQNFTSGLEKGAAGAGEYFFPGARPGGGYYSPTGSNQGNQGNQYGTGSGPVIV